MIGGAGGDTIKAGNGPDVILGDAGHAKLTAAGLPILVETTYDNVGGDDSITVGNGDSVILGGSGGDTIVGGNGRSVVLGDNGQATFDTAGRVLQAATTAATSGARDVVTLGNGGSVVIGGVGADEITTGSGSDVVVGDNGSAVFLNAVLVSIESLESTFGAGDLIKAGEGDNTVIGGVGADDITTGAGKDVVIGDEGKATFTLGVLTRITTKSEDVAGDDTIRAGDGDNVVLGGSGNDTITTGIGNDVVLGDNGAVDFVAGVRAEATSERAGGGGRDTIVTGAGADLVIGGLGADAIDAGATDSDPDIVFGDDAHVTFDAIGRVVLAEGLDPTMGGDDVVTVGGGDNLVLGGAGSDDITSGSGKDVILGDNGSATFALGIRVEVTSDRSGGARDTIRSGAGADVVVGGLGGDIIDAGATDSDADIVIGDDGHLTFDALGRVTRAESLDPSFGGDDVIDVGGGDNIVIGGVGNDAITAGAGSDVVIGDNGFGTFLAGVRVQFSSSDPTSGGDDTIKAGDGDNIVIAGIGNDSVTTGLGRDIILGDDGLASFTAGVRAQVTSLDPIYGGDDTIIAGDGDKVVIAGTGNDAVTLGTGDDIVLGDDGYAKFVRGLRSEVSSTDPTYGGRDTIIAGNGANVVIAGIDRDSVTTGSGDDIVLGDDGLARFDGGVIAEFYTLDPRIGADDVIRAGDGANIVVGGGGRDQITSGLGADVILGDSGEASFTGGHLVRIATTDPTLGDDDTIDAGDGANVVIGGAGRDRITSGAGADVALGDNGAVTLQVDGKRILARTTDPEVGDVDTVTLGDGDNLAIGGTGADSITTGTGRDVILGDLGQVGYDAAGLLAFVLSTDTGIGGSDTIAAGDGANVVLGGVSSDQITTGTGSDIVLGDNGRIDFAAGVVTLATSLDARIGDADTVTLGNGAKAVIGGAGSDTIKALDGDSVVLGDAGLIRFAAGRPVHAETSDVDVSGDDGITLGNGNAAILGGSGADTVTVGNGRSVVLGDNGTIDFDGQARPYEIASTAPDVGGRDVLTVGDGGSVVLGGVGADSIVTGSGPDIILGDNGAVTLSALVPVFVRSTSPSIGSGDEIRAGEGDNIVIGGADADLIVSGAGRDVLLGDNGSVRFDAAGLLQQVLSTDTGIGGNDAILAGDGDNIVFGGIGADRIVTGMGADTILGDSGEALFRTGRFASLATLDVVNGGDDVIDGGTGDNLVMGGIGNDAITTGSGSDVILGDDGFATFAEGILARVDTRDPTFGGNDTIQAGDGDNIVFGGFGADDLTTGSGADLILGDNGLAIFGTDGRTVLRLEATDPLAGAGDQIHAGAGNDVVGGGTGNDVIWGGAGNDILFGDHMLYDLALPVNQRGIAIFTGTADGSGDDILFGEAGDDRIYGQQGDDTLSGGDGDDDLTGGSNVLGAADGNDLIYGGNGADVVLGDNGVIVRYALVDDLKTITWQHNPGPFADTVLRDVVRFDLVDGIGGNDQIYGEAGDDRLFGQLGDDLIGGGDGNDDIVGGLGSDVLRGDAGNDILLGDEGRIVRAFNPDGSAVLNGDGSWHRDVVLEEIGDITASIGTDARGRGAPVNLTSDLLDADLLLVTGAHDASGADVILGDTGAWQTAVLAVRLAAAYNDDIGGGDGDDVLFGQRGDDTLSGGAGDDVIYGDRASNTAEGLSDLPTIVNAVRIMSAPAISGIDIPLGGAVVVPAANLLPEVMNASAPRIEVYPYLAGTLEGIAGAGPLHRTDGASLEVYASLVPNLVDTHGVLAGNDAIDGGDGNDTIYGDDGQTFVLDVTRYATINGRIDSVSVAMQQLLAAFDGASAGYDGLRNATGAPTPVELRYGNDTISGGAGNDLIVGDAARIIVRGTGPLTDLSYATASALSDFLAHMRTAIADATMTALEVQGDILGAMSRLVGMDPVLVASPKVMPGALLAHHHLVLGNDTIDAGDGNDLVVGDALFLVQSGVARTDATLDPVVGAGARIVQGALAAQAAAQDAALSAHLLKDHPYDPAVRALTEGAFGRGRGYALTIGNDRISGGAGNDILIGDTALIQLPAAGTSDGGEANAISLAADRLQVIVRMFTGTTSPFSWNGFNAGTGVLLGSATSGWGPDGFLFPGNMGAVAINNDIIDGGAGQNRIFASTVMLVPAIDAGGRMVGPNALFAIEPGQTGPYGGVFFNQGWYGANVGIISANGSPTYVLGYGGGGRYTAASLAAYNAAYWGVTGPGSPYGFYPYTSYAYGSLPGAGGLIPWGYNYPFANNPHPGKRAMLNWYAGWMASIPWQGGGNWGWGFGNPYGYGANFGGSIGLGWAYNYPFAYDPYPGKRAVLAWYYSAVASAPWFGGSIGTLPWNSPSYVAGQDQVTGGTGYTYLGTHKHTAYWSYDAGVTLPALGAGTTDLIASQASRAAATPIQGLVHRPLLATDVIRSIQGSDIVLRVRPQDLAVRPAGYATWLLDEGQGSLLPSGRDEEDILFVRSFS